MSPHQSFFPSPGRLVSMEAACFGLLAGWLFAPAYHMTRVVPGHGTVGFWATLVGAVLAMTLGAWASARLVRRFARHAALECAVATLIGVWALALAALSEVGVGLWTAFAGIGGPVVSAFLAAVAAYGAPLFCLGALGSRWPRISSQSMGAVVWSVFSASSLLAFLVSAWVVWPRWGLFPCLIAGLMVSGVAALWLFARALGGSRGRGGAGLSPFSVSPRSAGLASLAVLLSLGLAYSLFLARLEAAGGGKRGAFDGYPGGEWTARRLGHLAMLLCPAPKTAVLLGAQVPSVAEAVGRHESVTVTVVEPRSDVMDAARSAGRKAMSRVDGQHLGDIHFRLDEAIRAVAGWPTRVDVIVSQPPSKGLSGGARRDAYEFLRAARTRLAPSGVYAQPFVLSRWSPEGLADALATMRAVFPSVTLWILDPPAASPTIVAVCAERAPALDLRSLTGRMAEPSLSRRLRALAMDGPEDLLALYLCDGDDRFLPPSLTAGASKRMTDLIHVTVPAVARSVVPGDRARLMTDLMKSRRRLYPIATPPREVSPEARARIAARANTVTRLLSAGAALAKGDTQAAGGHIQTALRGDSASRLARAAAAQWGARASSFGQYEVAIKWFEELLKICPDYGEFYRLLASAYEADERPFRARQTLEEGSRAAPDSFAVWRELGRLYAASGDVEAALDALANARRLRPADPEIQEALRALSRAPRSIEDLRILRRRPAAWSSTDSERLSRAAARPTH